MTNILHLIDTYRVGGPGKTVINSARFIDQARYRVHVGSFTSPDESRNEFATAVRRAQIPYLELPETRRVNLDHVRLIRTYIRRHDIAIVHAHGYRTDFFGYLAAFGLSRVRIVTTHHGWIRNSLRADMMARGAQWLAQRFDGVQVVSRRLMDELPRSLRQSERVALVHNGIVLDDYRPTGSRTTIREKFGLTGSDTLCGVVGRLSPEKGCMEMLAAFSRVAACLARAHLLFIGEGPLKPELRHRVSALDLADRVHFVEHQPKIQPFFDALDIVVSPSWTEGLSNVILEALALEKPVVATRVGGTPEIVEDGVSALLVEPGNAEALADAIVRVAGDATMRRRLVAGGTARVRAFDFKMRMRNEEQFYARILGRVRHTVALSFPPAALSG